MWLNIIFQRKWKMVTVKDKLYLSWLLSRVFNSIDKQEERVTAVWGIKNIFIISYTKWKQILTRHKIPIYAFMSHWEPVLGTPYFPFKSLSFLFHNCDAINGKLWVCVAEASAKMTFCGEKRILRRLIKVFKADWEVLTQVTFVTC